MGPESFVARWWNAIRPLPSEQVTDPAVLAQKRKQRKLIRSTVTVVLVLVAAGYGFHHYTSAPERARAEYEAGMRMMGPNSYPEAIKTFTHSISIWPNIPQAYLNRGIAYYHTSQRNEALDDFDRAIQLDPNLVQAYDEQGRIALEKRDTKKAIESFSKSLSIKPSTDGFYARALAYESIGEHQKAIDDFDKAIAERVDAPYAYRARASAKASLGDMEGAKADREIALSIERPRRK
ncbi:MAG: tetratricopeptide repeat protein [Bryobacteraceae bacterium]